MTIHTAPLTLIARGTWFSALLVVAALAGRLVILSPGARAPRFKPGVWRVAFR